MHAIITHCALFVRENSALSRPVEHYNTVLHYSLHPRILYQSPHQLQGDKAAAGRHLPLSLWPVTLGTEVQLMRIQFGISLPARDYGERQEPSLSHLGCSLLGKTAIVTTSLPQAAPLHKPDKQRLHLPAPAVASDFGHFDCFSLKMLEITSCFNKCLIAFRTMVQWFGLVAIKDLILKQGNNNIIKGVAFIANKN